MTREMGRIYHAHGIERLVRNELWRGRSAERFYDALEWLYGWTAERCLRPSAAPRSTTLSRTLAPCRRRGENARPDTRDAGERHGRRAGSSLHPVQLPRRPRQWHDRRPARGLSGSERDLAEVAVTEYRNGNSKELSAIKITGLNKATDVTMKRGVIGALDLYNWLNDIRNGNQNALRTVTVQLQSEDRSVVVQTWKLLRARIVKYASGPLNGKGNDVAIEEIVLAYERLELE